MKKQFYFLAILCLASLVLVACNTAKQNSIPPTTTEETHAGNEGQPTESSDVENETNSITYTTNNVQKTEETTTVNSNEQQYSIQILPNFTLTAEEPGKDMLYLTEDDSISMRIESMSVNDTSFQNLVKNTEEMMSVVNENVQYTDFKIQSFVNNYSNINNYTAYKVDLNDQIVISVVFEKDNQLVRLTIFDDPSVDLTEAMIKMGLTISKS